MHTTCDEMFDDARRHLEEARQILGKIFIEKPWGYDEYDKEFLTLMHKRYNRLSRWDIEDNKK